MAADKTGCQSCRDVLMRGCRLTISKKRFCSVCSYTVTCVGTGTADAECFCWGKGEQRSSGTRLFTCTAVNPGWSSPCPGKAHPCRGGVLQAWPLLDSAIPLCYCRDQPSLELCGQPWWHQAVMQKGSLAPSYTEVTVRRKHIDIKH